jgi:hypothetical protein
MQTLEVDPSFREIDKIFGGRAPARVREFFRFRHRNLPTSDVFNLHHDPGRSFTPREGRSARAHVAERSLGRLLVPILATPFEKTRERGSPSGYTSPLDDLNVTAVGA